MAVRRAKSRSAGRSPAPGGDPGTRPRLLLAFGAAAGLALAAAAILRPAGDGMTVPPGAVAAVNDQVLPRDDYERAIASLAKDRRDPIGAEERRHVLDRLIDEELLLQRGIELGLMRSDPRVRSDLVSAVIDGVSSEAASREPSDADVARFYGENGDLFAQPGRVRLRQLVVRVTPAQPEEQAKVRAEAAAARLRAGEPFSTVADEFGDAEIAPLPDALLPPIKLREYLGPTATRTALELPPGKIGDPVRSSAGYHVLEVLERDTATVPPLAEIESQVRAELRRRNAERALRSYLDDLRSRARVRTATDGE